MFRERVRILEIVATTEISIFGEFMSLIDEISYFTFSNNSDIVPARRVQTQSSSSMM